jgi:hypothetical protein
LWVVGIVLVLQASTIPIASATQDAGVQVVAILYEPGQTVTYQTTIGELEASSCPGSDAQPALQGPGGSPEPGIQPAAGQEWALATVLTNPACLPGTTIDLADVEQVTVVADGQPDTNASAQLSGGDLASQGDPNSGPVLWDSGSSVTYVRPPRSATDPNALDMLNAGQSLQFDVYEGAAPVAVGISATSTSVAPGASVTFAASVPSGASGESFHWTFDGAAPDASGASASAIFATAGVYEVTVQATGAANGFGSTLIYVGSAPAATGTTTTLTGPATGSGAIPGAGIHKVKRKPTGASRTTATRAPSKSTTTPAAAPAPAAPATSGAPATSSATATATARSAAPAGGRRRVSEPPASGPAATLRRPGTLVVRGRLLGTALASDGAHSGATGAASAPRVNRPRGDWPWAAILSALVVVALLGLGAGRELRSIRFAP